MTDALSFLRAFNHEIYTIATIRRDKETGKSYVRSFPVPANELSDSLDKLPRDTSDIYFTPNEGSGILNEKRTACHREENVINLTSLFLDCESDDKDNYTKALAFFKQQSFTPHYIIRTSQNRYHWFWILEKTPITKHTVKLWKQLQIFFHTRFSSDKSITDTCQLLRVPTFKNHKRDHLVIFDYVAHNLSPYSLKDTYDIFNSQFDNELKEIPTHEPLKPLLPDVRISQGERHEELLRRVRKLFEQGLTEEEIQCFTAGFINRHFDSPHEFLNGGSRSHEVQRTIQDCRTYFEESRRVESVTAITKAITQSKKSKDSLPFELDSEFYYQAPGIVGELTRHIVDTSIYPCPSLAFAASVALFSFARAKYMRSSLGVSPANFFLCFAPSGSGKTIIVNKIKDLLFNLKLTSFLQRDIASAQSLLYFLEKTQGTGIVIFDEIKKLFQITNSTRAASYQQAITPTLTELYSSNNSYFRGTYVKTDKGKPTDIAKPCLTLLGFGQPHLLKKFLDIENVQDGFLARFLVFSTNTLPDENISALNTEKFPACVSESLHESATKSLMLVEQEVKNEISFDIITPPIHPDALPILDKFKTDTRSLARQALSSRLGLEALFTRAHEQIIKLSLAMCNPLQITPDIAEFASTLVQSQVQQFHALFKDSLETDFSKEVNKFYIDICELLDNTEYISKRDLRRRFQGRFRKGQFEDCLNELLEQGRLTLESRKMPSGRVSPVIMVCTPN